MSFCGCSSEIDKIDKPGALRRQPGRASYLKLESMTGVEADELARLALTEEDRLRSAPSPPTEKMRGSFLFG